jgi:hypothetical protein
MKYARGGYPEPEPGVFVFHPSSSGSLIIAVEPDGIGIRVTYLSTDLLHRRSVVKIHNISYTIGSFPWSNPRVLSPTTREDRPRVLRSRSLVGATILSREPNHERSHKRRTL